MSPHNRKTALNLGAWTGALVAVVGGAYTGGARVVQMADERYVADSAFVSFQQGLARKFIADSLNAASDLRDMRRMVAGLDSSDRCRRGQTGFCR